MKNNTRTRAEMSFAAIEKRQEPVLSEQEEAARMVREKSARLKALRLTKQAATPAD